IGQSRCHASLTMRSSPERPRRPRARAARSAGFRVDRAGLWRSADGVCVGDRGEFVAAAGVVVEVVDEEVSGHEGSRWAGGGDRDGDRAGLPGLQYQWGEWWRAGVDGGEPDVAGGGG